MKYLNQLSSFQIQCFCLIVLIGCTTQQQPNKPQVFEPGNISTKLVEYGSSFSSDATEVYFSRSQEKWGTRGMKSYIYHSVKEAQGWSAPKLVSFSGEYDDSDPHLTNNGKTLYFISRRPSAENEEISADIWKVEKTGANEWGDPIRLANPINSPKTEYSPRTDAVGNLYFASDREGGLGQGDLYKAEKQNTGYASPMNLGRTINSEQGEWNLEINQDGNLIIFEASGRKENLSPYGDLYISFKLNEGWSIPQNMIELNSTGSDLCPELIEVNDLLYYSSSDSLKSTNTEIYAVGFKGIYEQYRASAEFSRK